MNTKNLIKTVAFILFSITFYTAATAQKAMIQFNELPQKTQSFINTHFKDQKVNHVIKDTEHLFSVEYEIYLENGTKMEFDKNGNWKEVNGKMNPLPTSFILVEIVNYIMEHFNNEKIMKIENKTWGYEVTISNGMELEFNNKGKITAIDN